MTDIQSASSVSPIKSHFLLGGSAQLRRQLPPPSALVSRSQTDPLPDRLKVWLRETTSAYCFNAIFGCCICWSINCPAFPGTKKGIFLSQKGIYPVS